MTLDHLTTEARNPASMQLDALTPRELAALMNAEDAKVVAAVATVADAVARAIEIIAERLRAGGRLVYVGAGTSGRLGVLDAAECPPTFSTPPELVVGLIAGGPSALTRSIEGAEDDPSQGERDLTAIGFTANDVLVGIATSGRTPYVLGAVEHARRLRAFTIGLSCNTGSEVERAAELAITPVVGPEVLSGSTRLKAGTATKLVLNMLSTGAMVRLGKTFGNLMVDLKTSNSKLRARTNRIVRILTGATEEQADEVLQRCGGELKVALVAQLAGLGPDEARVKLTAAGGQVSRAVETWRAGSVSDRRGEPGASATGGSRTPVAHAPGSPGNLSERVDESLVIGIDGGGTHTVAVLAEAATGKVLGRGETGPSNVQAVGLERGTQALDEATALAFAAAGMARRPVGVACFGLAGADRAEEQRLIADWAMRAGLAARVEVVNDARILLAAGTPAGWGVAVVAGTGSIAFGRSMDGRLARAGGWGFLFGDEGSGYGLALAGLRAAAQSADGRAPATALLAKYIAAMAAAEPSGLITAVYRGGKGERPALSALAPLVLETAAAGDAVARGLVADGARELAVAVASVVRALELSAEAVPLALTGGLLLENAGYRNELLAALPVQGVRPGPVALVEEPALGAVRLACTAGP